MRKTTFPSRNLLRARAPKVKGQKPTPKLLKIDNVLVPIDFSQPSLDAVEFALPLLKSFGAELHLTHVVTPDYPFSSLSDLPVIVPELEIGRRIRQRLKNVVKKYSVELRPQNIHALHGRPFEQICQLARNIKIDLIITSTRGQTGLKHLLLGSTAERIVRYAPCPVLVVRLRHRNFGNGNGSHRQFRCKTILVPVDFSKPSAKALDFAAKFARKFRSKLVLLHSVNPEYYVASDEYARYDFPALLRQTERVAQEQLHNLVRKSDLAGLNIETSIKVGHAGEHICGGAEHFDADLIVTSTHGRTGFKHALVGSTAEYVVRHADCSVLVVPGRERPILTSTPKNL